MTMRETVDYLRKSVCYSYGYAYLLISGFFLLIPGRNMIPNMVIFVIII